MALAAWACLAAWVNVFARWRHGVAVLPYQPRRRVPWRGLDVLAVFAVGIVAATLVRLVIEVVLGAELTRPPLIYDPQKSSAAHTVARLLAEGNTWTLLLCAFSAAVVAPIVEEFMFRMLLQGWLEAAQGRLRRRMPTLRRIVPGAVGPIVLSSVLFGWLHFRVDTPMRHPYFHLATLLGTSVVGLVAVRFAIGLVRVRAGATAADLGWVPGKFFADVRLGLVAFAALAMPIYGVQVALVWALPKYVAPDPLTLFILALALGVLYHRTHRIVPVIVVHMALNTTSLAMAWMSMAK